MGVPHLRHHKPIPGFTDTQGYINYINGVLWSTSQAWQSYVDAAADSYGDAWHQQEAVLRKVKQNVEARKKEEEAALMFAFNLITVGVGGPLAGRLVAKGVSHIAKEETQEFVRKAIEKVTDPVKEKLKSLEEDVAKKLCASSEDPFTPPSVTPDRYGWQLKLVVDHRLKMLAELQKQALQPSMPIESVRALAEAICCSEFVEAAPDEVDQETLTIKTLLGLWLAWGWCRDQSYWNVGDDDDDDPMVAQLGGVYQQAASHRDAERVDFQPLYEHLTKVVHVPAALIRGHAWKITSSYVVKTNLEKVETMNMSHFINWANDLGSLRLLFNTEMPVERELFGQMAAQWVKRRMQGIFHVPAE